MKNTLIKVVLCSAMLVLCACSSSPEYMDMADSKDYMSMGIDYHDVEMVVEKSVQSLLNSNYVKNIQKTKTLVISDIINDTMQNFDVEQLARKVAREMRNSGKFSLSLALSGSGASKERMIDDSREKMRGNDEFNQYTVIEKGQLKGMELSLSGKIGQRNVNVGKKQRTDYYFLLTLTNLATGEVVWDEEVNITKLGNKNVSSW